MFYSTYESPIGVITIASDDYSLRELHIEGDRYFQEIPEEWTHAPHNEILVQACGELADYFKGKNFNFTVPLEAAGTDFQRKVWQEVRRIPVGATVSYAELATRVGNPTAVRAVGTAIGKNPLCIVIPCHRIIASSGQLGGYVAGLDRKRYLLAHEQSRH